VACDPAVVDANIHPADGRGPLSMPELDEKVSYPLAIESVDVVV
jgi:hypothetical protein